MKVWVVSACVKVEYEAHTGLCSLNRTSTSRPTFDFILSQLFQSRLFPTASFHRIPLLSHSFTFIFFALPSSPFAPHASLRVIFVPLSALPLVLRSPLSGYLR